MSAVAPVPALFPTTVVGSMPRPQFLKELFDEFHQGQVSEVERERLLDEAVPFAIALQEAAGVDIVSDGEWRRFSYVGVIADVARGFARGFSGAGRDGKYWHTVTAPIEGGDSEVLAEPRALRDPSFAPADQGRAAEPVPAQPADVGRGRVQDRCTKPGRTLRGRSCRS